MNQEVQEAGDGHDMIQKRLDRSSYERKASNEFAWKIKDHPNRN